MPEFDVGRFDTVMHEAVAAHGRQDYLGALTIRRPAREMAPPDSSELGRALRDDASDYDRLNWPNMAEQAADEAFHIHDSLVTEALEPTREAYRERSASGMYIAASGLRRVIKTLRAHEEPTRELLDTVDTRARGAWSDIQDAKRLAERFRDRRLDQYEINQARRISMAATATGSRMRGLRIAAKAILMSPFSESRWLGSSDQNFTPDQRRAAKKKAFLGGVAAFGFGVAMTAKQGRRQDWVLDHANAAL